MCMSAGHEGLSVAQTDLPARTDPLLGAIAVEAGRGTSVVGVEAGEGSLDIIE
jgi:hypothetical protein